MCKKSGQDNNCTFPRGIPTAERELILRMVAGIRGIPVADFALLKKDLELKHRVVASVDEALADVVQLNPKRYGNLSRSAIDSWQRQAAVPRFGRKALEHSSPLPGPPCLPRPPKLRSSQQLQLVLQLSFWLPSAVWFEAESMFWAARSCSAFTSVTGFGLGGSFAGGCFGALALDFGCGPLGNGRDDWSLLGNRLGGDWGGRSSGEILGLRGWGRHNWLIGLISLLLSLKATFLGYSGRYLGVWGPLFVYFVVYSCLFGA